MNEKEIAKTIIPKLLNLGFIAHRYDAYSTNSIYLKLDFRSFMWYSNCWP